MKLTRGLIAVAALLASLRMVSAGDITGKVTLKGNPPPEKDLPLDPNCGKLHPEGTPKTRFYLVGKGGELADAFVYIKEGLTGKHFPAPGAPLVIDQKGCEYSPYVSGVQVNQTINVLNSDPVLHNVHPTPAVAGNKESNQAQLPKSKPLVYNFANPELFLRFKCDVHPWMFSYVSVMEHPFFAVTDKDGNFKIANVPPGTYTVEVMHRKAGKQTAQVTVEATGAKTQDFTLEVPK